MLLPPTAGSVRTSGGIILERRCLILGNAYAHTRTARDNFGRFTRGIIPVGTSMCPKPASLQRNCFSGSDDSSAVSERALSELIPAVVSQEGLQSPDDTGDNHCRSHQSSDGDQRAISPQKMLGVDELRELEEGARVYAVSDLHTDHAENMAWVRQLVSRGEFHKDVLIVAGDVSDCMEVLSNTLSLLASAFLHVFFVPGNHDLWCRRTNDPPSSVDKLHAVIALCDRLGVHTRPRRVGSVWVVPLWSWYHASFDTEPDLRGVTVMSAQQACRDFRACKWPSPLSARDDSVAHFFDSLNSTIGHLPPVWSPSPSLSPMPLGSSPMEPQARAQDMQAQQQQEQLFQQHQHQHQQEQEQEQEQEQQRVEEERQPNARNSQDSREVGSTIAMPCAASTRHVHQPHSTLHPSALALSLSLPVLHPPLCAAAITPADPAPARTRRPTCNATAAGAATACADARAVVSNSHASATAATAAAVTPSPPAPDSSASADAPRASLHETHASPPVPSPTDGSRDGYQSSMQDSYNSDKGSVRGVADAVGTSSCAAAPHTDHSRGGDSGKIAMNKSSDVSDSAICYAPEMAPEAAPGRSDEPESDGSVSGKEEWLTGIDGQGGEASWMLQFLADRDRGDCTVISFSHFLPRLELCPEKRVLLFPNLPKVAGSVFLESRVRQIHGRRGTASSCHVFGHTHFCWDMEIEGVRYIQAPLAYPRERHRRRKSITDTNTVSKPGVHLRPTRSDPTAHSIQDSHSHHTVDPRGQREGVRGNESDHLERTHNNDNNNNIDIDRRRGDREQARSTAGMEANSADDAAPARGSATAAVTSASAADTHTGAIAPNGAAAAPTSASIDAASSSPPPASPLPPPDAAAADLTHSDAGTHEHSSHALGRGNSHTHGGHGSKHGVHHSKITRRHSHEEEPEEWCPLLLFDPREGEGGMVSETSHPAFWSNYYKKHPRRPHSSELAPWVAARYGAPARSWKEV